MTENPNKDKLSAGAMTSTESVPKDRTELAKMLERAQQGDTSTLPILRKMLEDPDAINTLGGNMANQVERSIVDAAAGKSLAFRLALLRKLEVLRAELAGPTPSPVERLLAERAVTCWLYLHDLEVRFVQAKELTLNQANYRQRALDRAQRRYLSALKMLAIVRRLAVPALQVNIAAKQKIVGGTADT